MKLSMKQQTFSGFLALFLKCTSSFEHLQTKDDPHSLCVFEITYCERRDEVNV